MTRLEKIFEMLEAEPKDNFLRHALALEYVKLDENKKARNLFEAILQDSPTYTGSYYHLGKLLEREGEKDAAVTCYEKGMAAAKAAGEQHTYNELQSAYEDLVF